MLEIFGNKITRASTFFSLHLLVNTLAHLFLSHEATLGINAPDI